MSDDRYKIRCLGGHVEFINTGTLAFLEMLGDTRNGGQRRLIHVELTRENVREIRNVAQAFLNEIGARDEGADDIFGPEPPNLRGLDGGRDRDRP
jgi:hypothetical protein